MCKKTLVEKKKIRLCKIILLEKEKQFKKRVIFFVSLFSTLILLGVFLLFIRNSNIIIVIFETSCSKRRLRIHEHTYARIFMPRHVPFKLILTRRPVFIILRFLRWTKKRLLVSIHHQILKRNHESWNEGRNAPATSNKHEPRDDLFPARVSQALRHDDVLFALSAFRLLLKSFVGGLAVDLVVLEVNDLHVHAAGEGGGLDDLARRGVGEDVVGAAFEIFIFTFVGFRFWLRLRRFFG